MEALSPPGTTSMAEPERWQVADGILFSVLSSAVIWSLFIASVYGALD